MKTHLYQSLLNTAYKSDLNFIDEIDTIEALNIWFHSNDLTDVVATEELIFNLQNIRHIMKKILNQISSDKPVNFNPLNKFSEKYKTTDSLIQIGRNSVDFLKDGIMFDEPYQSILMSFKRDIKGKQDISPA
jgi:hypothetical protein